MLFISFLSVPIPIINKGFYLVYKYKTLRRSPLISYNLLYHKNCILSIKILFDYFCAYRTYTVSILYAYGY